MQNEVLHLVVSVNLHLRYHKLMLLLSIGLPTFRVSPLEDKISQLLLKPEFLDTECSFASHCI